MLDIEKHIKGAEFIVHHLSTKSDADTSKPIGNYGIQSISDILKAMYFGLGPDVEKYIDRANRWLDFGIERHEVFGVVQEKHQADMYRARGIGFWLENASLRHSDFSEARRFQEACWGDAAFPRTRKEIIDDGLPWYMPLAVLGDPKHGDDAWAAGKSMYEQWHGQQDVDLSKRLKPAAYAYALCCHYLDGDYDSADLHTAGARVLRDVTEPLLKGGRSIDLCIWLMTVHWQPVILAGGTPPSPIDTLLRVYDYLPGVTRPF